MNEKLVNLLPNSISLTIKEILNKTNDKNCKISNLFEGYVIVHYCPPYKQTQHFSMNANNLINVMYHTWNYNKIESLSNDQQIEDKLFCGLFEGLNVYEIRNDNNVKSILDRGIPFGKIEERSCFLHGFARFKCLW